jgi:FdhE protein
VGLPIVEGGVVPEAAYVVLPRTDVVFAARAARLRALAEGHAAGAWLDALASVCEAQHAAVETPRRDDALRVIVSALGSRAKLPAAAGEALERIERAAPALLAAWAAWIDAAADGDRSGDVVGEAPDPAVALFVAAALQVEHAARAAAMHPSTIPRAQADCPVCRAPAAAGVISGDTKTRYLACSRCSSAWHRVRLQCVTCAAPASKLEYLVVEAGRAPGVKAEACGGCRRYLKLFYAEDRPGVEPLADDAATLALDLRLGEDGWARGGANPLVAVR